MITPTVDERKHIWDEPLQCSLGGVPYNQVHIDYWQQRAIKAEAALAAIPSIKIQDVTAITDALLARSGKFKAFFSRAELEEHIAIAMAPHYKAYERNGYGKIRQRLASDQDAP